MKLSEIVKVVQQSTHGLDLSKWDGATQFRKAKVETFPLLANVEGDDYFFCIEDPKTSKKMAYLKALKVDGFSKEAFMIQRTWVEKSYRNKGLMTAMYNTLHHQGFTIFSDIRLSPESLAIWKKLKVWIKVIHADTHATRDPEDKDFTAPDDNPKEQFVLEGSSPPPWGPCRDNFLIEELHNYIDSDCP